MTLVTLRPSNMNLNKISNRHLNKIKNIPIRAFNERIFRNPSLDRSVADNRLLYHWGETNACSCMRTKVCNSPVNIMEHVALVAITWTNILVHYRLVKSQQLIWRLGTRSLTWHIWNCNNTQQSANRMPDFFTYRQTSNIKHTKSQNFNVSRLVL